MMMMKGIGVSSCRICLIIVKKVLPIGLLSLFLLSPSNTTRFLMKNCSTFANAQLFEEDRLKEYHARNYTWPPPSGSYKPQTMGWKNLMEHRLRQVAEIDEDGDRYEGYIVTLTSALFVPNFTEHGFGLAKAPEELMEALRKGVRDGVAAGPGFEAETGVIEPRPWFIYRPDLTKRVLEELHRYPETWVDMELEAHTAYGFRLYRDNSQLLMHIDKPQTHIVSFILHIDSSDDAEPWPIYIEDFYGRTHEVVLKSGDMLFYESSKVLHGRPKRFKGSWYSSIFAHYYPKNWWQENYDDLERHYTIPPTWNEEPTQQFEISLKMVTTGMKEPMCPNDWCSTQNAIKWTSVAKPGEWIAPTGDQFPFDPTKSIVCENKYDDCDMWASWDSNECIKNPNFMLKNCKKACKTCTIADESTTTISNNSIDTETRETTPTTGTATTTATASTTTNTDEL